MGRLGDATYNVPVIAISLQSGSNGNCIYVEEGATSLLLDAGISGLQAERRLEAHGRDIRKVTGVIISHDHSDHVRSAGIFQRKFRLPLHITAATLRTAGRQALGQLDDVRPFEAGSTLEFGRLTVQTIRTPHDAADGVAFIIGNGKGRLGVLTDLGHVFDGLADVLATLDGVFLESNYDPAMLERGPYPEHLKARIRGPHGHLSNGEAATLLARPPNRLRWACLAHLSEHNNEPAVALKTHREVLGNRLPLFVASRYEASGVFEV